MATGIIKVRSYAKVTKSPQFDFELLSGFMQNTDSNELLIKLTN